MDLSPLATWILVVAWIVFAVVVAALVVGMGGR